MFRFKKPVGGFRPVRKSHGSKEETLRRLRSFLETEEPVAVDFLARFWKEQQAAVSYADIKSMIASWNPSNEMLAQWQREYAALVNSHFAPQWERLMQLAAEERRRQFPFLVYDPGVIAAQEYIVRRGGELITMLTNEQGQAIRSMITQATHYDAITPDVLARIIRPVIGLTERQANANLRYWNSVWQSGVEAGMSPRAAEARADRLAATYAARQHRYRAMAIARTELAMAYNEGAYGATVAAQEQGYLGDVVKVWLTAADERVCKICAPLDGEVVNLHGFFPDKSEGKRPAVKLPPAHPQCRCAIAYEEISQNLQPTGAGGMIAAGGDNMSENPLGWLETATEGQKIKFFGGKTKSALYDAGMLAPEDFHKPLREIDLSGVKLPSAAAMRHTTVGDYTAPTSDDPGGRLKGGGHGQQSMIEMGHRGILYNVESVAKNGVRFGNVPRHPTKWKSVDKGQAWFPKSWTERDIYVAGIATANKGTKIHGYGKEMVFNSVNVRILTDAAGEIRTIAPSHDQP